jgi:predicted  nucleic acid-binding Zn-ribbon protein
MKNTVPTTIWLACMVIVAGCSPRNESRLHDERVALQGEHAALQGEHAALQSEFTALQSEFTALKDKNRQLKAERDSLSLALNRRRSNYWFRNSDAPELLEMGIENPEEYIIEALKSKPEVIPLIPDEGLKNYFDNIQLLGREWIIAYYEDGHCGGRSIFRFWLNESGELEFAVIATLFDC